MKTTKEIFVICNSAAALDCINRGEVTDITQKDLFTCNGAASFFRTEGKHYNFFTDAVEIMRNELMPEKLTDGYEDHIQHIYHANGVTLVNGNIMFNQRPIRISPVKEMGSSAVNAAAFAAIALQYERIWLVGYTFREWASPIWETITKAGYMKFPKGENMYLFAKQTPDNKP